MEIPPCGGRERRREEVRRRGHEGERWLVVRSPTAMGGNNRGGRCGGDTMEAEEEGGRHPLPRTTITKATQQWSKTTQTPTGGGICHPHHYNYQRPQETPFPSPPADCNQTKTHRHQHYHLKGITIDYPPRFRLRIVVISIHNHQFWPLLSSLGTAPSTKPPFKQNKRYYWITAKIGLNGLDPDLGQNKHRRKPRMGGCQNWFEI
jgi:hypothetical protein